MLEYLFQSQVGFDRSRYGEVDEERITSIQMVQNTIEFGLIIFECKRKFVELNVFGQLVLKPCIRIGKAIQIEKNLVRIDVFELPGLRVLKLVVHQKKERGFCLAPFIQFLRKVSGRVFQAKSGIIRLPEQLANLQSSETNS